METRTVNRGVLEHLFDIAHPSLLEQAINAEMIRAAGDAIADMMLDVGYQVETSYMDAADMVQCYLNPRTGAVVNDLAFTVVLVADEKREPNLHILLRVSGPQDAVSHAFSSALRKSRGWYLPLNNCATILDVLDVMQPDGVAPWHLRGSLEWRAAA